MKNINENLELILRNIECKCPMCECLHVVEMCWTEPFRPRVYCEACRKKVWIAENEAHRRTVQKQLNDFLAEEYDDTRNYAEPYKSSSSPSDYSMDHFYEGEDDDDTTEGDDNDDE